MSGRNSTKDKDLPRLGWRDMLALTIAAYQVLLPFLLVMVGAVLLVYLLFRFVFS